MTREEWEQSDDPSELLSHAALHIPRRHLCLVLAELAQRAAAAWERAHPDEWRLAWGIAVVRAWCFFEADDDDLERAQQALAPLRPGANGRDERGFAAGECVARLLEVTCWPTRPPLPPRSFGLEEEPRAFARSATLVARHAVWAAGGGALAQARTMAALIRQRVLFTAHTEREWLPSPGLVFAGQAVLRIDGWALGDIVGRADFSQLSAERSVAFDQAQQEAAPESDALVAHRAFVRECIEQREAQAKKDAAIMARGGCVGSEVISNGQAFRRIACYGPPDDWTPPPPPPPRQVVSVAEVEPVVQESQEKSRVDLAPTRSRARLLPRPRVALASSLAAAVVFVPVVAGWMSGPQSAQAACWLAGFLWATYVLLSGHGWKDRLAGFGYGLLMGGYLLSACVSLSTLVLFGVLAAVGLEPTGVAEGVVSVIAAYPLLQCVAWSADD